MSSAPGFLDGRCLAEPGLFSDLVSTLSNQKKMALMRGTKNSLLMGLCSKRTETVTQWKPHLRATWWTQPARTRLSGQIKPRLTIWSQHLCLEEPRHCLKTAQQWCGSGRWWQRHSMGKVISSKNWSGSWDSTTFSMTSTQRKEVRHTGLNTDGTWLNIQNYIRVLTSSPWVCELLRTKIIKINNEHEEHLKTSWCYCKLYF